MTTPWRHAFVQANGLRFHYVEAGTGPLVLLLHGFPESWRAWRHQIPALAQGRRVVAVDLRGYGDSDKPPRVADYAPDILSADVAALIQALGAETATVIGHDWGGAIAWGTALDHPKVVEKLVVVNCPHPRIFLRALSSNPAQMLRSWYMLFFQLPLLPELVLSRRVDSLIVGSSTRPEAFTAEDRAELRAAFQTPGAARAAVNYYRAAFRARATRRRVQEDARRIAAPTLLLWGDRDQALGRELTEGMDPLFSGRFEQVHFPDASHWVCEEQPEAVNREILRFLRS
jgi:pimeloyl-ACP methyl ester carboxylesterase